MKIGGDMGMGPGIGPAPAAQPQQGAPAPNYREAQEPGTECMSCGNYDMPGRTCQKFNFPARPHFTCDEFAPQGEAPAAPMMPPAGGDEELL